jgi:hypothetical protein
MSMTLSVDGLGDYLDEVFFALCKGDITETRLIRVFDEDGLRFVVNNFIEGVYV